MTAMVLTVDMGRECSSPRRVVALDNGGPNRDHAAMKPIESSVEVAAPTAVVWRVVTDIENAAKHIPAIRSIEILPGPRSGPGLRWRETRMMFGRTATETMEIAEWKPPFSHASGGRYVATATNHGTFYRSEVRVDPSGTGSRVTFTFEATGRTIIARFMTGLMMPLMNRAVVTALSADLRAIKAHCERVAAEERGSPEEGRAQ
jgi:carbon monoxide dehydrogenase subunit G